MKRPRARVRPVPTSTPGVHFDAGAPSPPELPPAEMQVRYIGPEHEDPEIRAEVIAWLARLLRQPGPP